MSEDSCSDYLRTDLHLSNTLNTSVYILESETGNIPSFLSMASYACMRDILSSRPDIPLSKLVPDLFMPDCEFLSASWNMHSASL